MPNAVTLRRPCKASAPHGQFLKVFGSPGEQEEPNAKRAKTLKAWTQPNGTFDAFYGWSGSSGAEETTQPGATSRQNDIETDEEDSDGGNNNGASPRSPQGPDRQMALPAIGSQIKSLDKCASGKGVAQETKLLSELSGSINAAPSATDLDLIRRGFYPKFITGQLLNDLWRYTLTRTPHHVNFRKKPVKSRPIINYGIPNEDGEYGLYRWGQEKRDWGLVEPMPLQLTAIVNVIEKRFGLRPNHAIATYYQNGKDHWIPVHSDKAVSLGSKGGVESQTAIFNLSLGATRLFIITKLTCLGKKMRKDLDIVAEFPLASGDLYALDGDINSRYGHCVPVDGAIKDLRVSYTFRCVTKDFVQPGKRYYRKSGSGKCVPLPPPEQEAASIGEDEKAQPFKMPLGNISATVMH